MSTIAEPLPVPAAGKKTDDDSGPCHEFIADAEGLFLADADDTILLRDATFLFKSSLDDDFAKWDCNIPGPAKPATGIIAHRLVRRTKLAALFKGINQNLDSLCFNQGQILQFIVRYAEWFSIGFSARDFDGGTFFLIKSGEIFFVVRIYRDEKNVLRISIYSLDNGVEYDPKRKNYSIIVLDQKPLPMCED